MDKKLFVAYRNGMDCISFSPQMKNQMHLCEKEVLIEIIEVLMENNKILRKYVDILEKR